MSEEWREQAACRNYPIDTFFQDGKVSNSTRKICWGCPVQTECLIYSFNNREEWGVWGGLSRYQRREILEFLYKEGIIHEEPIDVVEG